MKEKKLSAQETQGELKGVHRAEVVLFEDDSQFSAVISLEGKKHKGQVWTKTSNNWKCLSS